MISVCSSKNYQTSHIGGLALSKESYKLETYNDEVLIGVTDPCINCAYLIEQQGGELWHFKWRDYIEYEKARRAGHVP